MRIMMLKRLVGASATTGAIAMAWSAYTRRPLSHLADPGALDDQRRPSSTAVVDTHDSRAADSLLHVATRAATLFVVTAASRAYLEATGVSVLGLDAFHTHLAAAARTGRPVLTVSNHMSVYDDPIILSYIAPRAAYTTAPWRHRWGGCSEEICFKHPALAAFFGAGKVLPVWRGGGLSQPMFAELADHLCVPGSWVHLFPEGCICQRHLNHSDVPARRRPYLRWGVGKMIARAHAQNKPEHAPVVVPFFHQGLEQAMPLREDDGTSLRVVPRLTGDDGVSPIRVRITFGEIIACGDLVDAFLAAHGKEALISGWDSPDTEEALQLYSAIAARVHRRMSEIDPRPVRSVVTPEYVGDEC
jgi:monolysocardiolipin acyltransferase